MRSNLTFRMQIKLGSTKAMTDARVAMGYLDRGLIQLKVDLKIRSFEPAERPVSTLREYQFP
jgi:hypothetical protein